MDDFEEATAPAEALLLPATAATPASFSADGNSNSSAGASASDVDFDEMEYLTLVLGPQRQTMDKLIPLTVVYIGRMMRTWLKGREGGEKGKFKKVQRNWICRR